MPDYLSDHVHLSDDGTAVVILDQTCLPNRTIYRTLRTAKEMFDAIHTLQVRGAPAIGICAAYDLYVLAQQISARSAEDFLRQLQGQAAGYVQNLTVNWVNGWRDTFTHIS